MGRYRGAFVGPAWVRMLAQPALKITGLGGWWGKLVDEDGRIINLVSRKGELSARFPMRFAREKSHIDGRDGLTLYYEKNNPILWLFVADEIRRLDESTLLGMTRPTTQACAGWRSRFFYRKLTNAFSTPHQDGEACK